MLKSKTIDRVCCLALAVMLALTAVVWVGKASAGRKTTVTVGYEGLFDQSTVHTIDIEMADWAGFIATATQEEYTACTVTIDGERLADVGIRAKGNTSLSSVASMGSEKYSFKIEFDHYVKGRLYKGLDKLSLNNLIYDATMMKDYLAYTLMGTMGVPASLCSFVQVNVNGEPWGLYLAVEGVEDGFLERNNLTTGELYKPDSMGFGGGRGNGRDFDFEEFRQRFTQSEEESTEETTEEAPAAGSESTDSFGGSAGQQGGDFDGSAGQSAGENAEGFAGSSGQPAGGAGTDTAPSFGGQAGTPDGESQQPGNVPDGENQQTGNAARGGFNFGGFGMGNSDVKLQYIDDDPDSYVNIFDNAKTKVGKKDKARLIETLKTLSSENAQDAVFTDEVIRYLAVHDFLCNGDSYTGMMVHNYYLYEEKGRLAILPWDYNLAFGGMSASDGTPTVNSPIDSPVSNGDVSDRPLVAWIFNDEEALAAYHTAYDQFVTEVIESGWLAEEIDRVSAMIRPYVAADANSFYTAEAFDTAIDALQSYCALRGESIRGQLEGTIPSTSEARRQNSAALVDGSSLDISAMGAMNTGRGGEDRGGFTMPGNMPDAPTGNAPPQGGGNAFAGSSGGQSAQATEDPQTTETPQATEAPVTRPAEFTPPEGFDTDPTPSGMSWPTFALYVCILLAAIVLVARVPGKEM